MGVCQIFALHTLKIVYSRYIVYGEISGALVASLSTSLWLPDRVPVSCYGEGNYITSDSDLNLPRVRCFEF